MATLGFSWHHHAKKRPHGRLHGTISEKRMRPFQWSESSVLRAQRRQRQRRRR